LISAGVGAQHDVLDIMDAFDVTTPAHHVLAPGKLDQAAAHVTIAGAHRVDHHVERELVGCQLVGIDRDLILAHLPAHRRHFGNAGHALHGVAQKPVLIRAQLVGRVLAALVD